MRVVLVPHTHWDREWYDPFAVFRDRLVGVLDGLLDLLDREPRFRHFHLDGQAAMIDDYLAVRPEREGDLRRHIAAGRLSVGPWFTQMDEFLTSGESHIRNLEWGRARAAAFGAPRPLDGPEYGYLPDQFGHIGQMPQILRNAGIERAVVWRGVPRAIDRAMFWWSAPDGSRVLAESFPFGYGAGRDVHKARDAAELAGELGRILDLARPYTSRDVVMIPVGDDHQGPPVRIFPLLEDAGRQLGEPLTVGSVASFLAAADVPGGLPEWRGELRSAARAHLLPNVYSTRPAQKRTRGRVEVLVERYAEPLGALVPGMDWPGAELDEIWRRLLWNGAHDSVCGCSHDGVAHDVDARYVEAERLARGIIERALRLVASRAGTAGRLAFNPSPFERGGVPGMGWALRPSGLEETVPVPIAPLVQGDAIRFGDVTVRLLDEDDIGDLYTFCPPADGRRRGPNSVAVEDGAALVTFDGVAARLRASAPPGEPFIRLDGRVDNARPNHRLWLRFELPAETHRSIAASPFELVERPLVGEGGELEAASPTWPARGAVLAGGLALLSEGVVEYEVDGRELGVVLLRAVGTINVTGLATRPGEAGPGVPTPEAQLLGRTEFAFGVASSSDPGGLMELWERHALPLLEVEAPGGGRDGSSGRLLEVSGAQLSAVRRVESAVEVRIWNDSLQARLARVGGRDIALGPARIETVRLAG